jgi:molybdate transport system ATP-binding protein
MLLLEAKGLKVNQQSIHFQLHSGEILAIIGPNGSGKSTLAKQISGQKWISEGILNRHLSLEQIIYTDFTADALNFNYQNFYYQQRYHAAEEDYGLTLQTYTRFDKNNFYHQFLFARLFPQADLSKEMIKLSSGETRKALIIKTLINEAKIYILDNPFTGLDQKSIQSLQLLFGELRKKYQKSLIILSSDLSQLPNQIQHIIQLEKPENTQIFQKINAIEKLNQSFLNPKFSKVLAIRNAQISLGRQVLLQNLEWCILKGEKWLLKGANGSGKSTLLSLLYADNPKSYSYDLQLFDRPRGSGESIWEIKKKIGFISPEIQAYWNGSEKVSKVVLSGLMDSFVPNRAISTAEMTDYELIMDCLAIQHLAEKSIFELSSGEKRMVMLARAIIKNPPVLVIDEPFQALDAFYKQLMYKALNILAIEERTIIQVAHLEDEVLPALQKVALIEDKKLKISSL